MAGMIREIKITVDRNRIEAQMDDNDAPLDAELPQDPIRDDTISLLASLLRYESLKTEELLKVLGANLYAVLLNNNIGETINKELVKRDKAYQYLKISLDFGEHDPHASWPWEYLYSRQNGHFLANFAELLLVRNIPSPANDLAKDLAMEIHDPPLRVLFVASSPQGMEPVPYQELLAALKALQQDATADRMAINIATPGDPPGLTNVTYKYFRDLISGIQPHIIHFVGYARCVEQPGAPPHSTGQIAFMSGSSTPEWVEDQKFAELLFDIRSLRLVFLQACESSLPNRHPAVSSMAMRVAVMDKLFRRW
jgi:hypothetical protein